MHLLSAQQLEFSWGYKPLISKLSFDLDRGQALGIAGPNGAGKSTLVKLIMGSLAPDAGRLQLSPGTRVALVPQMADFGDARTVLDCLLAGIQPLAARVRELEEALAAPTDEATLARRLAEFGAAQEAFLAAGGYQADERAGRLVAMSGLDIGLDQDLATLSGGERSVLAIIRALVADPDLLILDEPGNHLDYLGLAWLEGFLGQLEPALLLVSHNRHLLDRVTPRILYLEAGRHWLHSGGYSDFRRRRQAELAEERREWAARERELRQLNIELKNLQSQAAQSCNPPPRVMIELAVAKRKIAELRKVHDLGLTPQAREIRIRLKAESAKGEIALQVRNLDLAYDGRVILDKAGFELARGDRAALVGLNGSGKSSLIRLIREEAAWDNPRLRLAPAMKVGYLSQRSPFADTARRLVDEVRGWGPLSIDGAFNLIAPFAFAWEELEKPLSTLSGGELQRLQLALLCYRQVNFLILDEPSNHLDIPGRECLEACLADFPGTMLIVSHDRWFLDSFATRILHLENGRISEPEGSFSQFLAGQEARLRQAAKPRDGGILNRSDLLARPGPGAPAPAIPPVSAAPANTLPSAPATPPGAGSPVTPPSAAPSAAEAAIARLEGEIGRAEQAILEALDRDPALAARLEQGLGRKRAELRRLWEQWMEDGA